jgi:hypothetical protein
MVGFSLGAHVVGMAGKGTRRGKVNTIVGLDPAGEFNWCLASLNKFKFCFFLGPLFAVNNPSTRLAAGDADYVEGKINPLKKKLKSVNLKS